MALPFSKFRIALLVGMFAASVEAQHQSPVAISDIIQKLRERETILLSQPSIYVEFVHERQYMPDETGLTREYHPMRIIVARKRDMLLTKAQVDSGDQMPSWFSWKDNIGVRRYYQALTIKAEPDTELYEHNHYHACQFLDFYAGVNTIPTIHKMISGATSISETTRDTILPASIENTRDEWGTPTRSTIDGVDCVVISRRGLDTIWLDPNRGYACRRREWKDNQGKMVTEWHHRDFYEYVAGLWLPRQQTRVFYFREQAPSLAGMPRLREHNRLVKASFVMLPDTFFDIPIPEENGVVQDLIRDVNYELHPHEMSTDELLTRSIVKAARIRAAHQPWQPGIVSWTTLIVVFALSALPVFMRSRA